MVSRRPIVGVVGSGANGWGDRSLALGRWLASIGVNILTGGGHGVMASVSQGFAETPDREGVVIGILPCRSRTNVSEPKEGYPNPWVEVPIATHLPLSGQQGFEADSRNHIVVLSSDLVVVLLGGAGTLSEAMLAVQYKRPVIAYLNSQEEISDLPQDIPVVNSLESLNSFILTHISVT